MDQIDVFSGLDAGSELYRIRRERPDFVNGAELCRQSVLSPKQDFGLGDGLRAALAARMARLIGLEDLAGAYDRVLDGHGRTDLLIAIAIVAQPAADAGSFIHAIVRHADRVTTSPRESSRADVEALARAGLDNAQIVALSQLIAFVNFEARVIVGLKALELVE